MSWRTVISDDEPLARDRMRTLLARESAFDVVAECADGEETVTAVLTLVPDLLFLDIEMPDLDGFGVLEALQGALDPVHLPIVVFVTAYDQHALRAFEASALDYLVKPFRRSRLHQSLERAARQLELRQQPRAADGPDAALAIRALADELRAARRSAARFAVRQGSSVTFVPAGDIDWLDAAGNYVRLHARGATHMIRSTIGSIEQRLDPRSFIRIHRSAIVNVGRVAKVEPYGHGEFLVTLTDGVRLTSSRTYSAGLRALLRSGVG
jgi:two-component system LytT family response regulator